MTETSKHYSAGQFRDFLKCNKENFYSPSWSTDFKLIKIEGEEIHIHVHEYPTEEYDLICDICPFDPSRIEINDSDEVDLSCTYFSTEDVIQLCKAVDLAPAGTKWILDGSVFEKSEFRCRSGFNASFFGSFFKESIAFVGVTFDHADFRKATFTGEAYFSQSKFSGDADFTGSEFSGDADFTGSEFSGYANFTVSKFSGDANFTMSKFSGDANFSWSKFSGDANFTGSEFSGYANFSWSKFSGYANFFRSKFSGDANFIESKFSGYANFTVSKFSGDANFTMSKFSGKANFTGSKFSGDAKFFRSKFSGKANFTGSEFSGDADFTGSEFSGDADFTGSEFSGYANFTGSEFSGDADFSGSTFASGVFFKDIKFNFSDAVGMTPKEVDFHNCTFSAPSTFTFEKACRISFFHSRFKAECNIEGKLEYLTLRKSVIDYVMRIDVQGKTDRESTALDITDLVVLGSLYIDWKKHNLSKSIYDGHRIYRDDNVPLDGDAYREISEQFQLLKEIYDRTGRYEDEDEALVQYMIARNKQRRKEIKRSGFINGGKGILSWLGVNVMNVIGRFGVSPLRVFGWMLLIPLLFAGVYTIAAPGEVATTFWDELSNSFISFMTLGLGLTDPLIWQQNYVIVEGFIGMFLIAYFTVSVARRTLR